jgi:hypothetical protein
MRAGSTQQCRDTYVIRLSWAASAASTTTTGCTERRRRAPASLTSLTRSRSTAPAPAGCVSQLNDELSERVLQLEAEYSGRREPLYSKRNALCRSLPGFWKRVCAMQWV